MSARLAILVIAIAALLAGGCSSGNHAPEPVRIVPRHVVRGGVDVRAPRLVGGEAAVVGRLNAAIDRDVDGVIATFERSARELAPSAIPGTPPSGLDGDYTVVRDRNGLISLRLVRSEYLGGAHPSATVTTWNLDLERGRVLALADLFRPGSPWLSRLSSLSRAALREALGADADAEWIDRGTTPDVKNFAAWALEDRDLLVTFQEYQVAPYALGAPQVRIEASDLRGVLRRDAPITP